MYRTYLFELLDVDEGNVVVESFEGCLYDQAVNNASYIMNDMVDSDVNGSSRVAVLVNEDAWEVMYEEYKTCFKNAVEKETLPNIKHFDPIYGVGNNKVKQPKLVISTEEDAVLDRLDGISLLGGNDGILENPGDKTMEEIAEELYLKAFAGDLDRAILSA